MEGKRERKREKVCDFKEIFLVEKRGTEGTGYGLCRSHLIRFNDLGSCALS
jgi:hypothetical protein